MSREATSTSFDSHLDALGHVDRRRLLLALLDANTEDNTPVEIGQLGHDTAETPLQLSMHHVHLPKLDYLGFVDANLDRSSVTTGPRLADALYETSGADVRVRVCDDETALLRGLGEERFDREYDRLVAYNADSWQGGFDLPFVRTRYIRRGVEWMLDGAMSSDLYDPVKKRLNTTHTEYGASADANTLTGAHEPLFEGAPDPAALLDVDGHPWYAPRAYDPFEDSGSAAQHYRQGNLRPVCLHNLADIHRTWELGELVRVLVPSKDITEKKL